MILIKLSERDIIKSEDFYGGQLMRKEVSFKNRDRFIQLGIAISSLRKVRGMSQEKLAEKAAVYISQLPMRQDIDKAAKTNDDNNFFINIPPLSIIIYILHFAVNNLDEN